jgi:hypothetical protein
MCATTRAALIEFWPVGFAGAPRPLGYDDRGRQILTFIEGEVPDASAAAPH